MGEKSALVPTEVLMADGVTLSLKDVRTRLKLTQAEMAQRIGVSQGIYSQWETNKRPMPAKYIERVQKLLG